MTALQRRSNALLTSLLAVAGSITACASAEDPIHASADAAPTAAQCLCPDNSSCVDGACPNGGTPTLLPPPSTGGGAAVASGSGGTAQTGGSPQSGGSSNTGGSPGTLPTTCSEPSAEVCASYQVGTHCGLTYEIWTDSASSCMTNTPGGFQAYWDNEDGNYLARKGVRPGSSAPVVTYDADYQPNGNSYLAIYGWTQAPLVEYYIVDSWGSWRPPGTEALGTVDADGGTYEIYRSERKDAASIEGTKTFWQYWSVRTSKRTSGTITVRPHFEAWATFGLELGSFYEVSLVVEGYYSSGSANVQVAFQ